MLNSNVISQCPHCKGNNVQLVTTVVESGTRFTSGPYYNTTQQTALAKRLSPPAEPTYTRTFGSDFAGTIFGSLLIALLILSICCGFLTALSICSAIAAGIWILVARFESNRCHKVFIAHNQWQRYMDDYRTWLYCHRCNATFRATTQAGAQPADHNDNDYQDEINRMSQMDNNEKTPSEWAAEVLQRDDWVILDLETTDLNGYKPRHNLSNSRVQE